MGQQIVCALKRRFRGSQYSLSQSGQRGNMSIVVLSLSYGRSVIVVSRGPHIAQQVKGYR